MLMTKNQKMLAVYKIFFGFLGASSIITEIAVLSERGKFSPVNFFSFFTIESNMFAAAMLIASAILVGRSKQSVTLVMLRGAATLYMLMTGIIFAVLLSRLDVQLTAVPWDNIVLHYIMPVALVVDWILDPPKKRIGFKRGLLWIVFPLFYVAYTLVRGVFANWYPYPFLNPAQGGYMKVAFVSICITGGVLLLVWLMTQTSQKLGSASRRS